MPRGDGTGPWGRGPMTGRGAGFCRGYGMSGHAGSMRGGFGRGGRGGGRGLRNMYRATGMPGWARSEPFGSFGRAYGTDMSKVEEIEALRQQSEYFQANLEDTQKRLDNLESAEP